MGVRLLIVEDHKLVADALATMLSFEPHVEVVAVTASGTTAVDLYERHRPDVVLMDITLEGLNGLESTRAIRSRHPDARIVVLTMHNEDEMVTQAVASGALGFVPKNVDRAGLLAAISAVSAGEAYLHPSITRAFLGRVAPLADASLAAERLTEREREVLEQLAQGRSTKQIAAELVVSEETIKTHLSRIYQKLGVSDRVQAVVMAIRQGLVR